MDITHSITLALVQGLTEFLPISSSAHLILIPIIAHWPDQGLAFDVVVHLGTLFAVCGYFWRDIVHTCLYNRRLLLFIMLATLPVCIVGYLTSDWIEAHLRQASVIAYASIGFGIFLWLSDRLVPAKRDLDSLTLKDALWIGFHQAIALIPGTSRSGITMTAARFAGFSRVAASRFSFFLAVPVIALAAMLSIHKLITSPTPTDWTALSVGFGLSFVSALACIHLFLSWINRIGFMPFVIYRILLGVVILVWL